MQIVLLARCMPDRSGIASRSRRQLSSRMLMVLPKADRDLPKADPTVLYRGLHCTT